MIKLITLFISILAFAGCSRSSSSDPNPPPVITDSVTSMTTYTPGNPYLNKDTFWFDKSNRILQMSFLDLGGTLPAQTVDSGTFYFYFGSSSWQPSGYNLIARKDFYTSAVTEMHSLTYDAQNRVILDSMTSISEINYKPKGAHYEYFDNGVVIRTYLQGDADYSQIDSIITVDGNYSRLSYYYLNGSTWSLSNSYNSIINTNYKNPYYSSTLSATMGAFLLYTCGVDFLSKNLTNNASLPAFTWSTDDKGRVALGSAADGSYINYTYK